MSNSTKGYERFVRGDGSIWYLCDYCIKIGFCSDTLKKMSEHLKKIHT